jgi:hypothetical protein
LLVRRAASGRAQAVCFWRAAGRTSGQTRALPFGSVAGSGQRAAERPGTHGTWLGQPAQADAFPACSDVVPGQCSGTSPSSAIGRNATTFHCHPSLQSSRAANSEKYFALRNVFPLCSRRFDLSKKHLFVLSPWINDTFFVFSYRILSILMQSDRC